MGAGFWDAEEFARQLLARDKNGDGKLDKTEVMGLILPHFATFDTNKDGLLDAEELKAVTTWLNTHHEPGIPVREEMTCDCFIDRWRYRGDRDASHYSPGDRAGGRRGAG